MFGSFLHLEFVGCGVWSEELIAAQSLPGKGPHSPFSLGALRPTPNPGRRWGTKGGRGLSVPRAKNRQPRLAMPRAISGRSPRVSGPPSSHAWVGVLRSCHGESALGNVPPAEGEGSG